MGTITLHVPINQASPLRPNRRDLAVTQGDDLTLAFTIYDNDTDSSAKNVTGGALRFRLVKPHAPSSETEVAATIIDAATGRMNVALTDLLDDISGEYRWQARWSLSSVFTTICEGSLVLRPEAPAA